MPIWVEKLSPVRGGSNRNGATAINQQFNTVKATNFSILPSLFNHSGFDSIDEMQP